MPYPENTSFSPSLPNLQWSWDSTSLGALKTCPRYYYYSIILGLQSRGENIHFMFGIGFHSALELYDRLRAEGQDHNQALLATSRWVITVYTWNPTRRRPWTSDDVNKNRETLIRAVIWYLDQFEEDPLETLILSDGKPAVELSFRAETGVYSPFGEEYLLCGHLDRVVTWNEQLWIVDRKTTKSTLGKSPEFFYRFCPDNQMSLYTFAGQFIFMEPIKGIIIDAAQTAASFTRFQRGFTSRTKSQLQEWFEDFKWWTKIAEGYAQANYWPQNDKACNGYISDANPYGCPYRQICGITPGLRPEMIKGMFSQRIWDPLVTREV